MDDDEALMMVGCILGLAVCILLQDLEIRRLRRGVQFAVVIAEKRMTDV